MRIYSTTKDEFTNNKLVLEEMLRNLIHSEEILKSMLFSTVSFRSSSAKFLTLNLEPKLRLELKKVGEDTNGNVVLEVALRRVIHNNSKPARYLYDDLVLLKDMINVPGVLIKEINILKAAREEYDFLL